VSDRDLHHEWPTDAMERREFIRNVLLGMVGLPTMATLLSGCDGEGLLANDQGGGTPAGDLDTEVGDMRALQTQTITAIRQLQSAGDADVDAWLGQINAQLALVWPLMVAAAQQALRDNVAPEMSGVLAQLDGWDIELAYSGPAPQITRQQFQDAWDRAHDLAGVDPSAAAPAQDGDGGAHILWAYLFMLLVLFPMLGDEDALSFATDAQARDTASRGLALWNALHLTSVSCTPCLFSGLISIVFGLFLYLYLAMASHAAGAPGMLFGPDRLTMLVLIAALLLLPFDYHSFARTRGPTARQERGPVVRTWCARREREPTT